MAASFFGKAKTVAQYVAILFTIAAMEFSTWQHSLLEDFDLPDVLFSVPLTVGTVLLWIAAVLTVISGIQYVYKGRRFFTRP